MLNKDTILIYLKKCAIYLVLIGLLCKGVAYANGYDDSPVRPISWSPDAKKILYVTELQKGENSNEIYIYDVDSEKSQQILKDLSGLFSYPSFSPDSKHILFELAEDKDENPGFENPEDTPSIWIADADGANPKKLIDVKMHDEFNKAYTYPTWSPDSKRIYSCQGVRFGWDQYPLNVDIYSMSVEGQDIKKITSIEKNDEINPRIINNGKDILFELQGDRTKAFVELWISDIGGENAKPIPINTNEDDLICRADYHESTKNIVCQVGREDMWRICITDLNGKKQREILKSSRKEDDDGKVILEYSFSHPAFSPDGNIIACEKMDSDKVYSVILYNIQTGEQSILKKGSKQPVWSPKGDKIACFEKISGEWKLSVLIISK